MCTTSISNEKLMIIYLCFSGNVGIYFVCFMETLGILQSLLTVLTLLTVFILLSTQPIHADSQRPPVMWMFDPWTCPPWATRWSTPVRTASIWPVDQSTEPAKVMGDGRANLRSVKVSRSYLKNDFACVNVVYMLSLKSKLDVIIPYGLR